MTDDKHDWGECGICFGRRLKKNLRVIYEKHYSRDVSFKVYACRQCDTPASRAIIASSERGRKHPLFGG